MNKIAKNSDLNYESQMEGAPYTSWNSNYQKQLEFGGCSILKGSFIRKEPVKKKHNFSICKYPELPKHFLQIGDKNKFGRKEKLINLKMLQIVEAAELSLYNEFDTWKAEGKRKRLLFTPSKSLKIARIFITEESSLEILLMLADRGPQSIEELYNAFPTKDKTIGVLFDLWEYDVISVKENIVEITLRGNELVSKLRKKSQEK